MIDFFAKGGVLVAPILFCSVLGMAIFLERLIRFARMRSRGAGLAKKIANLLKNGKLFLHLQAILEGWKHVGHEEFQLLIDWGDLDFAHIPIVRMSMTTKL